MVMNKQELIKEINGLPSTLLDKRVLIDKSAVLELVDQLDEPERVVVPKFVAEWIKYCKEERISILGAYEPVGKFGESIANTFGGEVLRCIRWANDNQETFARAWLEGYEVEVKKLYHVEIPNPNNSTKKVFLHKAIGSDIVIDTYISADDDWKSIKSAYLTEAEIKQDFDWAWQWAEEVE